VVNPHASPSHDRERYFYFQPADGCERFWCGGQKALKAGTICIGSLDVQFKDDASYKEENRPRNFSRRKGAALNFK
jgi:hypothetical protein